MPQTPKSLATLARWGETWEGFVARAQRHRAACQGHPFLSLYQGALPPPILESLFFFSRTSFNHHTVKEPHSEDSFSAIGFPFSLPLVLFASLISRSLSRNSRSLGTAPLPLPHSALVGRSGQRRRKNPFRADSSLSAAPSSRGPIAPFATTKKPTTLFQHHTIEFLRRPVARNPVSQPPTCEEVHRASAPPNTPSSHRHHQRTRVFSRTCVRSTQALSPLTLFVCPTTGPPL